MKTELTILVPVYNGEETIAKSLDSLLSSSLSPAVIVLDDGSLDRTAEIVSAYAQKHDNIRFLRQENKGIAHARNRLVAEVKTPYFGFLDSDDTVRADFYECLLAKMKAEKSDIGFGDFLWVYDNGKTRRACDTGYRSRKELIVKMFATLWNKIYRTEWFRACELYFPEGCRYEDASLLYRLALHMEKVSYCPEIAVDYRQRRGSLTHSFDLHIEDMLTVFAGIRNYYEDKGKEYREEVEYLFIRFFLGNSYLRACRIADKKLRRETLRKSYAFLLHNYPEYRQNKYLREGGKKNMYYRHMNRTLYFLLPCVFRFLYRLGVIAS